MRHVCNVGYGRHSCEQFPALSAADAIRFHVIKEAAGLIQIQYVFEKDCWPRERGTIECSVSEFALAAQTDTLHRQAHAFVDSYLARRGGR